MPKLDAKSMVGLRIGQRTIIELISHSKASPPWPRQQPAMVRVRCKCGKEEIIGLPSARKRLRCRDCGAVDQSAKVRKHGESQTPLYRLWRSMLQRCHGKPGSIPSWRWYGAKGITVCDEWRNSFETFRDWASANGHQPGLSIHRLTSDRGYSPDNCTWLTISENTRVMQANKAKYVRHTPIEMLWGRA